MQFTKEVLESKPRSLEEGPMRCPTDIKNCVVYQVENRGILSKCMEIVKLILLLEVIFFIGWVGKILISNYHLEYNKDITAHDPFLNNLHGDEFPVTPNSISNDDIVSSVEHVDAISSTERQISTKPEMKAGFPSHSDTDESYEDNEWPLFKIYPKLFDNDIEMPDKIHHGKNDLSSPPIDNAGINIFEENRKSEKAEIDRPKVDLMLTDQLEDSSKLLPNSGLIHVIEERGYNSNFDSNRKSEVPFPLLKVLSTNKIADEEKQKLEDDTSEIDPPVKSILKDFEKYVDSPEPAIMDASEDDDFYMKEILFRPEDLDAISKDLDSKYDPADVVTKYFDSPEPAIMDATKKHDSNMMEMLLRPEDLDAIIKDLHTKFDPIIVGMESTSEPLDNDDMVLSEAEPQVPGSFDQLPRSTEAKNVIE